MSHLSLFFTATLLASVTPGPAVLLSMAVSVRSGLGAALRAIAGICAGSVAYLVVALGGVLAALVAHRGAFHAVQIAGAGYLMLVGARTIAARATAVPGDDDARRATDRPFIDGLVTQLSNPKAILYWTALLPPFVDPSRAITGQLLLYAAIGVAVDIVVLSTYSLGAARVRRWLVVPRHQRTVRVGSGTLFVLIGLSLAIGNLRGWGHVP